MTAKKQAIESLVTATVKAITRRKPKNEVTPEKIEALTAFGFSAAQSQDMIEKACEPKRPRGKPKGSRIAEPKIQRQIRATAAEWARIKGMAAEQGETISAYLRRRGLSEERGQQCT